jgi:N-acetylglucosaminyldiphosphoundecaprenol N-acetyl-beta-D-mannosaminyltransferase
VRIEEWIIDNQVRYGRGVFIAMGEAFALLGGRRSLAPPGLINPIRCSLCKDPLQLGPRYLRYGFLFLYRLLWESVRGSPPRRRGSDLQE